MHSSGGERIGVDDVGCAPGPCGDQRCAKAFGGRAREDRDQRYAGRGGGVLSGGIVAGVEIALRDEGGEAGEGAFPEADAIDASGSFGRGGDAGGFLPPTPRSIQMVRNFSPRARMQLRFEIAVDALGFVVADAEAYGRARGVAFDRDSRGVAM